MTLFGASEQTASVVDSTTNCRSWPLGEGSLVVLSADASVGEAGDAVVMESHEFLIHYKYHGSFSIR
jgi:hypothetical protein